MYETYAKLIYKFRFKKTNKNINMVKQYKQNKAMSPC